MVAVSLKKLFFQAEDGIRDIRVGDWSSDVCSSDLMQRISEMERLKVELKDAKFESLNISSDLTDRKSVV